jgi:hypothetical protein
MEIDVSLCLERDECELVGGIPPLTRNHTGHAQIMPPGMFSENFSKALNSRKPLVAAQSLKMWTRSCLKIYMIFFPTFDLKKDLWKFIGLFAVD